MTQQQAAMVEEQTITDFLETQNLAYQIYSVSDRALPLATSGVKPGAQRLLYSMLVEKITPDAKPRKSAKIVSTTTGSLHPHGESSMYGTLCSLASPYSRNNLIEGIGSFGQVPGDQPAADRYTEARLSKAGYELVREVANNSVPMRDSYDGEMKEPLFLPARFPSLLISGAKGVGEGWATTTPAHNPREVMQAARAMLKKPSISVDELLKIMPGPDWGTGGRVIGDQSGIKDYFATGKGRMTVRASHRIDKKTIVITEVPPGVSVPTLLNGKKSETKNTKPGIKDLARQGIIPGISDVSDYSDLDHGLRIEIQVKKGHDPEKVLHDLYKETDLEITYAASITALDNDYTPRWWSVVDLLSEFLSMRDGVILYRSKKELESLHSKLSHTRALTAVSLEKEKVTQIILNSEDKKDAVANLKKHTFNLSKEMASKYFDLTTTKYQLDETQAEMVCDMALHRLTKQDTAKALTQLEKLLSRKEELEDLLSSKKSRKKLIDKELKETAKIFDDPSYDRRTVFEPDTQPSGGTDKEVPDNERLSHWKIDTELGVLGDSGEDISRDEKIWTVTRDGKVKIFTGAGLPKRMATKPVVPDVDNIFACGKMDDTHNIVIVTKGTNKQNTAKILRLDAEKISTQGITGSGVAGIKLADGDEIIYAGIASTGQQVLMTSEPSWKIVEIDDKGEEVPIKGRGSQGVGVFKHTTKDKAGLIQVAIGAGFEIEGKKAKVSKRASSPKRTPLDSWQEIT